MAIEAQQLVRNAPRGTAMLEAFAAATQGVADAPPLGAVLDAVVGATAEATGADVVVARIVDPDGVRTSARSVYCASQALAAELEGSRVGSDELPGGEVDERGDLPPALRRLVERTGIEAAVSVPVVVRGRLAGSL